MTQTIAEALREEGREEGARREALQSRRDTLIRQMRRRFGRVPRTIERVIRATENLRQLETWLDNVVIAETLADMGISTGQAPQGGKAE